MIVRLTPEGVRRLTVATVSGMGSPVVASEIYADLQTAVIDAAIILGYVVEPPGWRRQYQ
jgi:hypothetical protein